jgi:thiaminase/transcriptional activator TenA
VVDIEQDRLPTTVFNRYLVFEGNFVATAIAIFALGVSKAPDIQQQRWLIGVLNALVDTQIAWFEQVLSDRRINPGLSARFASRAALSRRHAADSPVGQL